MTMFITITTRFSAYHCWPDAPGAVEFLRSKHRHVFHVKATKQVTHGDRDIEFILFKEEVDAWVEDTLEGEDTSTWSCERWAVEMIQRFELSECEVSEDGENGAKVIA